MDNRSASIPAAVTLGSQPTRKSYRHCVIAVVLTSAILGYGNELYAREDFHLTSTKDNPADSVKNARRTPHDALLEKRHRGDRHALRMREDAARHRLWVLTVEHVYVYDTRKLRLIRQIRLPNWSVADFICSPDMVLDQSGTAFVSNNVQSRLLQIGPANFRKKEHELRLISARQWETGFGGLAFGSDGTLFALSSLAGSLFKVDLASRSAKEIALTKPVPEGCALTYLGQSHPRAQPRVVSLCVGLGNRSRRIDLSSDLARGHVTNESCDE